MIREVKIILLFCTGVFVLTTGYAQYETLESHNKVAMRMVGHQVLLSLGDSTSRVLPIEKEGEKYKIQFSSEFAFNPGDIERTIKGIVQENEIANSYIVEVADCNTNVVVYSYEMGNLNEDIIPCKGRMQPKGCYTILFTILELNNSLETTKVTNVTKTPVVQQADSRLNIKLVIFGLFLLGLIFYLWNKRRNINRSANLISIGAYKFDQRNMELWLKGERFELTSKEADLLFLLYSSVNTTIERDLILKNVWGDEGDYIGRTLDVFISKLRKKLEADTNVKIINIRGVGYKMILNGED